MREKSKLRKNFLRNKKSFIFLLILCLGIGFAFLSTQLNITGNTSVSGNKWSVYFNNVQVSEGSVDASVVPATIGTTTTSLDYTVLLDKPGDYYEFTVDAVNAGTIDAMIDSITMTSLDADVAKYLNYTATYSDGIALAQNDVLKKNSSTTYKIRVEYKKDISASDLDEEGVELALSFGVNYVQSTLVSYTFAKLAKDNFLSDSSINFKEPSSNTNGKGLYLLSGTENDTNPIYYYRGNVTNNNVLFGDFCWKIVRTTETGGTKLIYNGLPTQVYKNTEKIDNSSYNNISNNDTYPFEFNGTNKVWTNVNATEGEYQTISFSVQTSGDYYLNYEVLAESSWVDVTFYKGENQIGKFSGFADGTEGIIDLSNLSSSDTISVKYVKYSESTNNDGVVFYIEKGIGSTSLGCLNSGGDATQISTSQFSANNNSVTYNGYMYGTVYETADRATKGLGYLYGNSFTYSNGSYTLTNTQSSIDDSHHYTCFNSSGECSQISYIFQLSYGPEQAYYITITDGKGVDDAVREMQTNTHDSVVKTAIDTWFSNTFQTYFTNLNKNYNDYLEDTVWCNDRSLNTTGESDWMKNNSWNPDTGKRYDFLYYSAYGRRNTGEVIVTCPNKNDAFTVNDTTKGNGALTYPVGLLTADEVILAGGTSNNNTGYYLCTGNDWWTMTPSADTPYDLDFVVSSVGFLNEYLLNNTYGIRPSISIKSNVKISALGDGTVKNPYEFEVE